MSLHLPRRFRLVNAPKEPRKAIRGANVQEMVFFSLRGSDRDGLVSRGLLGVWPL